MNQKRNESNDIMYCIKNSITKHLGHKYSLNFDISSIQANYMKAAT